MRHGPQARSTEPETDDWSSKGAVASKKAGSTERFSGGVAGGTMAGCVSVAAACVSRPHQHGPIYRGDVRPSAVDIKRWLRE